MKHSAPAKSAVCAVLISGFAIALSACGSNVIGQGVAGGNFLFATGGTSGTYYPLGGAIAQIVNASAQGANVTIQSTGASKENIRLVSKGDADYAIVQNDVMDYASRGVDLFEGERVPDVSAVCALYPEVIQIVTSVDSKIDSVADLKGKKVSIGSAGSGIEANALQIMKAYGLDVKDISPSYLSFQESGMAFKDGQIDAFFVTAGVPNTSITEISVTRPIRLLNVDSSERDALIDQYPFYSEYTVSRDVYKTESNIDTIAVKSMIACSSDLKEDVVYEFVRAIYENLDALSSAHAKGAEFSLESAVSNMTVDLHPGAVKYFKEKGMM